jgi:chromosome segregation ATPase
MNKKYNLVVLTLIFIMIFSFSVSAVEIKDIPKNHWAYKSVETLINKGYLSLYEDDTFKGDNKVTRYELAVLIARILDDIQQNSTQVTKEDANSLRKLSLEFRGELVNIAKKQDNILGKVNKIEQNNVVQTDAIGKTKEKISGIEQEISNIIDNIMKLRQLEEEVNGLNDKVKEQKKSVNNLQNELNDKSQMINDINNELNKLTKTLGNHKEINELRDQQSITLTTVYNLKEQVNKLEEKVESQGKSIEKLRKDNEKSKMYIGAVALLALVIQL